MGKILRANWEMVRISELCSLITDGTHQTPTYSENGYIFLSSKNVTTGKIDWDEVKYIPQELHEQLYKRLSPQKNDILLAKNGTTGICAKVDRDVIFDIYVSLALLRPKSMIEPDYFVYAINNPYTKRKFNRHLKGIGVPNLHLSSIKETSIPLPALDEQKRIAKNLDLASEIVKGYKEQLAELDKLVQSVFYEMFSTLIEDQATYKPLIEVAKFIDYRGKTPEKSDTGIPLITAKNVKMNVFSLEPQEFIPQNTYEAVMTRGFPQINDVLFTTEAPLGNVCRIPNIFGRFVVGQRLITMQPIGGVVTSEYLEFILSSKQFQNEMRKHSSGSTVKGIRSKELVQLFVSVPPFHLQTRFAEIVTEIESQKAQIQQALTEAENLFNSLMQEYFE